MWYRTQYTSPLGELLLASDGASLTGLWIEGQKYERATVVGEGQQRDELPVFQMTREWLDRYFAGQHPAASELPLAPEGSDFRQAVWKILLAIPYGRTVTYGEIAKELAGRLGRAHMSGQAVGGAVAHNPISIIIPCHRVVGSDGNLTGYAGGIQKKVWLLCHEGADLSRLSVPVRGTAL